MFGVDVKAFLDENDVRYTPDVSFTGISGMGHKFDYVIPKSRTRPERLVKAINSPKRDNAMSLLFAWTDTKDSRPLNPRVVAIINDREENAA